MALLIRIICTCLVSQFEIFHLTILSLLLCGWMTHTQSQMGLFVYNVLVGLGD
jgi:hypothetical protein